MEKNKENSLAYKDPAELDIANLQAAINFLEEFDLWLLNLEISGLVERKNEILNALNINKNERRKINQNSIKKIQIYQIDKNQYDIVKCSITLKNKVAKSKALETLDRTNQKFIVMIKKIENSLNQLYKEHDSCTEIIIDYSNEIRSQLFGPEAIREKSRGELIYEYYHSLRKSSNKSYSESDLEAMTARRFKVSTRTVRKYKNRKNWK